MIVGSSGCRNSNVRRGTTTCSPFSPPSNFLSFFEHPPPNQILFSKTGSTSLHHYFFWLMPIYHNLPQLSLPYSSSLCCTKYGKAFCSMFFEICSTDLGAVLKTLAKKIHWKFQTSVFVLDNTEAALKVIRVSLCRQVVYTIFTMGKGQFILYRMQWGYVG